MQSIADGVGSGIAASGAGASEILADRDALVPANMQVKV